MEIMESELSRRGVLKAAGAAVVAGVLGERPALAASGSPATLFATQRGKGRNVMFLHGWTCDSHDWSWQLPYFETRYRVVAVDLRGHGRSEVEPQGGYTPADYVSDVEALIESRYPGEPFVIVGHSMGGQIAARLAAKRPDLVSAVVSVDGALGFSEAVGEGFAKTSHDLDIGDPGVVVPALFELVYDRSTDPAYKRWHTRRVQGMPAHVVRESFAPLFFGADQVGIGEASATFCKRLTVPVRHLCRDPEQAARMRTWFAHPKSKVDVWDNTGHWIMQDRSDDVNAAVSAWIDAL
ncbi:Pimeloyl-ACP methyl ester carboxylesterase [Paraburkholderia unamae]|uniref:alpha/beta fold hydrolase n=1 Tax=Paraburkholderia unamae TaxID=219649 RepID=UPI001CB251B9|nr:alpha/beta hydrolase [Paraburkholderia unamae]CAG9274845.1 Pimeloyl-ACP methyl ester carboxylesterase [Paraburkholderia unamae]